MTRLGLETHPGFGTIGGVTLVGQWDADVVADLRKVAAMPVQVVDRLAPGQVDTRNWSVLLPGVQVGRRARLNRVVVDRDCVIPDDMVVGEDAESDAARFYRTESGITLITREMLRR